MNVLSLFSGAGGCDLGLEAAGMTISGQSEIEPAVRKILTHHWPPTQLWCDVRKVTVDDVLSTIGRPDLVVGGFPCQDLSVAGRRAGLAGERSGLYRELLRLTRGLDPDWVVVENVPGLLSASADPDGGAPAGSAMGLLLGDFTGFTPPIPDGGWRNSGVCAGPLGSLAWRVLDAQHFGVAQRRRRVFIVFHPRDRRAPGAVLLEPEGLCGDSSPRVPSWQRTSGVVGVGSHGDGWTVGTLAGTSGGWRVGADEAAAGQIVPLARTLLAKGNNSHDDTLETYVPFGPTHALTSEGADASEDGTGRGTPLVPRTAATLTAGTAKPGVSAPGRRQEDDVNLVPWTVSNDSQPVVTRNGGTGLGIPSAPAVVREPLALHENQRGELTVNDTTGALNSGGGKPGQGYPAVVSPTLTAGMGSNVGHPGDAGKDDVCLAVALAVRGREGGAQVEIHDGDTYNALRAGDGGSSRQPMVGLPAAAAVRRLTPLECERLMGWPDNHTAPAGSDSARYKACGNGVVANVAEWIGCRILNYAEAAA